MNMLMQVCRHCGSGDLLTKEIEIRKINALTMAIASLQKITEMECPGCGWTDAIEGVIEGRATEGPKIQRGLMPLGA